MNLPQPQIDFEEASQVVKKFIGIAYEHGHEQSVARKMKQRIADDSRDLTAQRLKGEAEYKVDIADRDLIKLQPLIEKIARTLDPDEDIKKFHPSDQATGRNWDRAMEAARRLQGIIENRQTSEQIFSPRGPVLDASRLHAWVWSAALNLWNDGHYKQAVSEAFEAVARHTRRKLEKDDLSGARLYGEAFRRKDSSDASRRLCFTQISETSETWNSAHDGAMHFGRGCALGIRNLAVHAEEGLEEQIALEYLAALSVLARWVDKAELR